MTARTRRKWTFAGVGTLIGMIVGGFTVFNMIATPISGFVGEAHENTRGRAQINQTLIDHDKSLRDHQTQITVNHDSISGLKSDVSTIKSDVKWIREILQNRYKIHTGE